ncbi:hypothetical protein BWI15_12200 [Kribbella sp. ALI-6-A]|uniref:hypothetical protein n=1 Tax=Kribbella sp. ALI-6-A TaxID=1933817 RepID=UPI00097C163E|nr:hypothetical protein [Kribbella sp. ALI-6-A]ONI74123.1 hypothetical protein BWI15_12200 [Kribbella sp. ALI-6-A]
MLMAMKIAFATASINAAIRTGDARLLDKSVKSLEQAFARLPEGHNQFPYVAAALAIAVRERYERRGDPADLERALDLVWSAANATPPDHRQYGWIQSELARTLTMHGGPTGQRTMLDEAVVAGRRSVGDLKLRGRDLAVRHTVLAIALNARHNLTGDDEDLAESTEHMRVAMGGSLRSAHDRATVAANNALSRLVAYDRFGRAAELDAAIESLNTIVSRPDDGYRQRLIDLSYALRRRHYFPVVAPTSMPQSTPDAARPVMAHSIRLKTRPL